MNVIVNFWSGKPERWPTEQEAKIIKALQAHRAAMKAKEQADGK
jgi:hypothetical protein